MKQLQQPHKNISRVFQDLTWQWKHAYTLSRITTLDS